MTDVEASLAISDLKIKLDFSKIQSDILFLKGVKQGLSEISVKIVEQGYEEVS